MLTTLVVERDAEAIALNIVIIFCYIFYLQLFFQIESILTSPLEIMFLCFLLICHLINIILLLIINWVLVRLHVHGLAFLWGD